MKQILKSSKMVLLLLAMAVAFSAATAFAATSSFEVSLSSVPAETDIPMGEAQLQAQIGDEITFTYQIVQTGVVNNAWQWNWDASKLNCAAYPDFDSPDFVCTVKNGGNSDVSITMYPIMNDGTSRLIESKVITVMVPADEQAVSAPEIIIRDLNFYQKYNGQNDVLALNVCNYGNATYLESEYGTLSFDITAGENTDGFAFSGDIDEGECVNFTRPDMLSGFYVFDITETGYYTIEAVLKNVIGDNTNEPFSKRVYIVDHNTPVAPALDNTTSTTPPAAGYEDEVLVNSAAYDNPFPDTNINTLEGMAASELYRRAVIGGYPDGEFKGDRDVNRAEAAKFLLLARYGTIADTANNGQFPDVLEGEWYVKFVVNAALKNVIDGYPDGFFRPANTVNTVEFLKMLTKTFSLQEGLAYTYSDVNASDWFSVYAGTAKKYNLFPDRTTMLNPGDNLTRKEVAIAMYQYLSNR